MKLLYSPGSPFARKVRVAIREKNLLGQFEEIATNPHESGEYLLSLNPLAKVPVVDTGDGSVFDSPYICEYLDSLAHQPQLIPLDIKGRLNVLRTQALADGIMDAVVASTLEKRRSDTIPSAHWLGRWEAAVRRSIKALSECSLPQDIRLDGISVACALSYVDFRLPQVEWHKDYSALHEWLRAYTARSSFAETAPPTA